MDYVDLTVINPVKRTTLHYQLCVRRNCRTWMLFEVHRYCVEAIFGCKVNHYFFVYPNQNEHLICRKKAREWFVPWGSNSCFCGV
ncbi:hypothetical protein Hdeb2414_s0037g00733261 [Helianthus debilis subsp. tardiflorus]